MKEKKEDKNMVDVKMTKQEMEEFAAFKATQPAPEPAQKMVEVFLQVEHSFNGVKYYKGKQIIREDHANLFLAQEDKIYKEQQKAYQEQTKNFQILGTGVRKAI